MNDPFTFKIWEENLADCIEGIVEYQFSLVQRNVFLLKLFWRAPILLMQNWEDRLHWETKFILMAGNFIQVQLHLDACGMDKRWVRIRWYASRCNSRYQLLIKSSLWLRTRLMSLPNCFYPSYQIWLGISLVSGGTEIKYR